MNKIDKQKYQLMKAFLESERIPETPISLGSHFNILNQKIFVKTSMSIIEHNIENPTFVPYFERLRVYANHLRINSKPIYK